MEVGMKTTQGTVFSMADQVAALTAFLAIITSERHNRYDNILITQFPISQKDKQNDSVNITVAVILFIVTCVHYRGDFHPRIFPCLGGGQAGRSHSPASRKANSEPLGSS